MKKSLSSSNLAPGADAAYLAEVVVEMTKTVFSTMLDIPVTAGPAQTVEMDTPLRDGVVALVAIGGPIVGSGRLYCTSEGACFFARKLLQMDFPRVDPQVLDAVAELANMIVGNLKTTLESDLGPLTLSVPTVIYGRDYLTHCSAARHWTVLPFRCEGHLLEVGFFFASTRAEVIP